MSARAEVGAPTSRRRGPTVGALAPAGAALRSGARPTGRGAGSMHHDAPADGGRLRAGLRTSS
jgi:hypothetical protein